MVEKKISRVLSNGLWLLQMAVVRDELWQLRLFLGQAVEATEVTKAGKCHQRTYIHYDLVTVGLICCVAELSLKLLRSIMPPILQV